MAAGADARCGAAMVALALVAVVVLAPDAPVS